MLQHQTCKEWLLHCWSSKDELIHFKCLILDWIPAHFWVGETEVPWSGSLELTFCDTAWSVRAIAFMFSLKSQWSGLGATCWVRRCFEDRWTDHLWKAQDRASLYINIYELLLCAALLCYLDLQQASSQPPEVAPNWWTICPPVFLGTKNRGGGHREKRTPRDTDFLAGSTKCQEEGKAIEFLICSLTLGESRPTAYDCCYYRQHSSQGAREQLQIFTTSRERQNFLSGGPNTAAWMPRTREREWPTALTVPLYTQLMLREGDDPHGPDMSTWALEREFYAEDSMLLLLWEWSWPREKGYRWPIGKVAPRWQLSRKWSGQSWNHKHMNLPTTRGSYQQFFSRVSRSEPSVANTSISASWHPEQRIQHAPRPGI